MTAIERHPGVEIITSNISRGGMSFGKTPLPFAVFVVVLYFVLAPALLAQDKSRPNILLIITDDQGLYDVGYAGSNSVHTPNIDKLRGEGILFSNFYANSALCSPTRAALLSGKYPDCVGVPGVIRTHPANNWGYLAKGTVLLPQVLKQRGYHSAIIGKWHLGLDSPNTPTEKGFDYFHGWLGDMMDDYVEKRRHGINVSARPSTHCE